MKNEYFRVSLMKNRPELICKTLCLLKFIYIIIKFENKNRTTLFNPTYYRPFGAASDIGGGTMYPPISYACSTCAIVMKL